MREENKDEKEEEEEEEALQSEEEVRVVQELGVWERLNRSKNKEEGERSKKNRRRKTGVNEGERR